jgi:ribokinase
MTRRVVVVGSLSVDFVMRVPRRPQKGETIEGFDFNTFVGGKGNNQALAAAKAGAQVIMIGRVGADEHGERIALNLREHGVDTKHLLHDKETGTGIANIYVDPEGDNSIVIVTRANSKVCNEDLVSAAEAIAGAGVLLLQLEIPIPAVVAAAKAAKKAGLTVILNPAPAPPDGELPAELLKCVDIIVPNQTEAELLTSIKVTDAASAAAAAAKLKEMGAGNVIVTMGEAGAFLCDSKGTTEMLPSFAVKAVDTTAAGDAFCGALAAALAQDHQLPSAIRLGCAAGALACTKPGAAPSLPSQEEIRELMRV